MKTNALRSGALILALGLSCQGGLWGQALEKKLLQSAEPLRPIQFVPDPATPADLSSSSSSSAVIPSRAQTDAQSSVEPARVERVFPVNERRIPPTWVASPNGRNEYGSLNVNGVLGGLGVATRCFSVPSSVDFDQSFDGSIEMWIKTASVGVTRQLIGKGTTGTFQFLFGVGSTSRLYFRIAGTPVNNSDGDSIKANVWTHVAVTWANGNPFAIDFYVNGVHSGSTKAIATSWVSNTDSVKIGGPSGGYSSEYFDGTIDEVRFWEDVRTATEIRDNRFVGLGDAPSANQASALTSSSSYASLIASWTFNGNYGNVGYDDIGGHNGSFVGGANSYLQDAGVPMPYNLALYLPGNDSAYVTVPHNASFDQNVDGSCEMWVCPTSYSNTPLLISKGATTSSAFAWFIAPDSTQGFRIGSTVYRDTAKVIPFRWSHLAVTWAGGSTAFTVSLYVNGKLKKTSTAAATWNLNSDPVLIGSSQWWSFEHYTGYLDEIRFWGSVRSQADIQKYMFVSGRSMLPDADLLGLWDFDSNLNNRSAVTGINASFNVGKPNSARLSGYRNETSSGSYYTMYPRSHSTVINWYYGGGPTPFPKGFTQDAAFVGIPDNNPLGVTRTLSIASPVAPLTSIQAFLSIEHTYLSDLNVTLKAPNGQVRRLLSGNAGGNENVLSFFGDNFYFSPASTEYMPPWGYLQPIEAFNTFSGSTAQGTWTLSVVDNRGGDAGVLKGWGLRFNGLVGVDELAGDVPGEYQLSQNYPNPFNPATTISYQLSGFSHVTLKVYDLLGRETMTLVNEQKPAGRYTVNFDASGLASGIYLYQLRAGSFAETKKMVLMK
jgi:subtilisin-like proprotein convertase family protein